MMDQEAEFRGSGDQQLLFAPSYCNIDVMCSKHCYATMNRDAGATLVYQLATVMGVSAKKLEWITREFNPGLDAMPVIGFLHLGVDLSGLFVLARPCVQYFPLIVKIKF